MLSSTTTVYLFFIASANKKKPSKIISSDHSCTSSNMGTSGIRSTVTKRTCKFIPSFTVATKHKTQRASDLNCISLVAFETEIVLSCPRVFLHKFGRKSFPSVSSFRQLFFTLATKCSATKDEGAEENKDMWRRDKTNARTAILFQSNSEFPLAWMKHSCASASSQQYNINLCAGM